MRIAVVADWFAESMGYAENALPRALAALGHEVHLVTSDVQPYYGSELYNKVYEPFLGPGVVPCGSKSLDGYTLHRLPHAYLGRALRISGLRGVLRSLRPDIVQCFDATSLSTLECALCRWRSDFRLFLGSHVHASVFDTPASWRRIAWRVYAASVGRLVSSACERCYAISSDAAEIASDCFGIGRDKLAVMSLGVDTGLFHPAESAAERQRALDLRTQLGAGSADTVCIYTGRLSADKDPLTLARAVDRLARAGSRFRGLFVGGGSADYVRQIESCAGCTVVPFVTARELPVYYHAADIGVWPRQESTSQLDAAACGLPLVLSDRIEVTERVHGNGLLYREGDAEDLAARLLELGDPVLRQDMGARGAARVLGQFSWLEIARRRVADYERALGS